MSYAWVITKDLIGEGGQDGMHGPYGVSLTPDDIEKHQRAEEFIMKDDDGIIYYEGVFVALKDSATGFEPLYDFGMPNAGCTEIHYRNLEGEWSLL